MKLQPVCKSFLLLKPPVTAIPPSRIYESRREVIYRPSIYANIHHSLGFKGGRETEESYKEEYSKYMANMASFARPEPIIH